MDEDLKWSPQQLQKHFARLMSEYLGVRVEITVYKLYKNDLVLYPPRARYRR